MGSLESEKIHLEFESFQLLLKEDRISGSKQ